MNLHRTTGLLFGVFFISGSIAEAQIEIAEAQQYHLTVSTSQQWMDHDQAFYNLLALNGAIKRSRRPWLSLPRILSAQPDGGNQLRADLIRALTQDTQWASAQSSLSEEFTNYEGDLIAAVASLHDPRSIDVLLTVLDRGELAVTGLSHFGQATLHPALEMLARRPSEPVVRQSILKLVGELVNSANRPGLTPELTSQARAALLQGLKDEDAFVRVAAIGALVALHDSTTIPALQELASHDTFQAAVGSPYAGQYTVRERANRAIAMISQQH